MTTYSRVLSTASMAGTVRLGQNATRTLVLELVQPNTFKAYCTGAVFGS